MSIVSNIALISINATMVVQIIIFLLLVWLLNRIMIKPLRLIMQERKEHLQRIEGDIVKARLDHKRLEEEIKRQEAEARREGLKIRKDLEKDGYDAAAKIITRAREKIAAQRSATLAEINESLQKIRSEMEAEAEKLSTRIMEILLNRRLS